MEKKLAEIIINSYENSTKIKQGIREGNKSVNFTKFADYNDDSNYKYRNNINEAANRLQDIGLIKIKWISKDNIIERIQYDLSDMDKFYELLGIKGKENDLKSVLEELNSCQADITNLDIKKIFIYWQNYIRDKYKLPPLIEDNEIRELIIRALKGIDELLLNSDTMYERVFSKKYLNSSKIFERKLRSRILSLIKKYFAELHEGYEDDQILKAVGIEKTTSELHMKGNIQFKLGEKTIDIADFPYGVALNSQTIRELHLLDFNFNKVISVENKANFNYLCNQVENSLVLFSGGFYTPVQKRFLNMLYKQLLEKYCNAQFYHWGDLDLGGFNIYKDIKNNIFYKLEPYKMSVEVIKEQADFCEKINDEKYILKLKKLLEYDEIQELHELIRFIIENKITLEQESLIMTQF